MDAGRPQRPPSPVPATHRVLPAHALAHVRLDGVVTGGDLSRAVGRLLRDPAWVPGYGVLWDVRGAARLWLEPADVGLAATFPARFGARRGGGRDAVLVGRDAWEDLARLFAVKTRGCPGQETRVFRDAAAAAAWLGVPPELLGA